MYIGRLGDGQLPEDGIYVLLKEVMDNSIDEFKMNAGKRIEVDVEERKSVSVRDYGRGIPQGKLVEAVSMLNTGGKYDSKAFKKSVGLNGVGVKAVNALSSRFEVRSYRDGTVRALVFERGVLKSDVTEPTEDENGTYIFFQPDPTLFVGYSFHDDFVETSKLVVLREELLYGTCDVLLEGALMGAALRGVLSVYEGMIFLAVLVGMREGNLDVLTLHVYDGIERFGGHRVCEQVGESVARHD